MIKYITVLFFGLLLMNFQVVQANEQNATTKSSRLFNSNDYAQGLDNEFNFHDSSYYLTDEQLQDAKNIDKIEDDKTGIDTRVINSSHFSSGTATKTWIPINKIGK